MSLLNSVTRGGPVVSFWTQKRQGNVWTWLCWRAEKQGSQNLGNCQSSSFYTCSIKTCFTRKYTPRKREVWTRRRSSCEWREEQRGSQCFSHSVSSSKLGQTGLYLHRAPSFCLSLQLFTPRSRSTKTHCSVIFRCTVKTERQSETDSIT